MPPVFDPSTFLSPTLSDISILQISAGAVLLYFVVQSLIILYHWFRYGVNPFTVVVMMVIYAAVSLPLASALANASGIF